MFLSSCRMSSPPTENFLATVLVMWRLVWYAINSNVGQTVNEFSVEWTSHPSNWNKPDIMDDSDQIVLPRNYSVFHDIINKPTIYHALAATFVKQPSFYSLDTCEDQCFDKRNANYTLIFKAW